MPILATLEGNDFLGNSTYGAKKKRAATRDCVLQNRRPSGFTLVKLGLLRPQYCYFLVLALRVKRELIKGTRAITTRKNKRQKWIGCNYLWDIASVWALCAGRLMIFIAVMKALG